MALGVGQSALAKANSGTSVTTGSVTTASTGSHFVIIVSCSSSSTINTPSDSKGNTYSAVGTALTGGGVVSQKFECINGTGGTGHTFTGTKSGGASDGLTLIALEVTGAASASPSDGHNRQADSATPFTSPGVTTTNANDILIGLISDDLAADFTRSVSGASPTSGWTIQQQENAGATYWTGAIKTQIVSATGTYNAGFDTTPDVNNSVVHILTYKEETVTYQHQYPSSDHTDGAWTPSTGADNYAVLDEVTKNTADYSYTNSNSTLRVNMGSASSPGAGTRTLKYSILGAPEKKILVRLIEGTTTVNTFTHDPAPTTETQYDQTVTGTITNYGDLDVEVEVADATNPVSASVTWGAAGTHSNNSGSSVTPSYPTGISSSTSDLWCMVTSGSSTSPTPTMPSGWTQVGTLSGGSGATYGVDVGNRRITLFKKDTVTGSESGNVTVSLSGGNTLRAQIFRTERPSGTTISYSWGSGQDTTNGTAWSVTSSGNLTFKPNQLLLLCTAACNSDATASSQAISASGITFGSLTNRATVNTATGNDHRAYLDTCSVTAGNATTTATFTLTASASTSGVTGFLLLEATSTEKGRVSWIDFQTPQATSDRNATASLTQAGNTVSGAITNLVKASVSKTQAGNTVTSTSKVLVKASVSKTQSNNTITSVLGILSPISAVVSKVQDSNTVASTSTVLVKGALTRTQAGNTVSATSKVVVQASSSKTQDSNTIASTLSIGAVGIQAQASLVQESNTSSSSSQVKIKGTISAVQQSNALTSQSKVLIKGTLSKQQSDNLVTSTTKVLTKASSTLVQDNNTTTATAIVVTGKVVRASLTQADNTCSSELLVTGTGEQPIGGWGGYIKPKKVRKEYVLPYILEGTVSKEDKKEIEKIIEEAESISYTDIDIDEIVADLSKRIKDILLKYVALHHLVNEMQRIQSSIQTTLALASELKKELVIKKARIIKKKKLLLIASIR